MATQEKSADEKFVEALRDSLLKKAEPSKVTAARWKWLLENAEVILEATKPPELEQPWGCYTRENFNNGEALYVSTCSGNVYLHGITVTMFV